MALGLSEAIVLALSSSSLLLVICPYPSPQHVKSCMLTMLGCFCYNLPLHVCAHLPSVPNHVRRLVWLLATVLNIVLLSWILIKCRKGFERISFVTPAKWFHDVKFGLTMGLARPLSQEQILYSIDASYNTTITSPGICVLLVCILEIVHSAFQSWTVDSSSTPDGYALVSDDGHYTVHGHNCWVFCFPRMIKLLYVIIWPPCVVFDFSLHCLFWTSSVDGMLMRKGADLPWDAYLMSSHDLVIGDPIAAGGEAQICQATIARDPHGPQLAVKRPHAEDLADPREAIELVLQEAWALLYITKHTKDHPSYRNVVTLHGLCINIPNVPHLDSIGL